MLSALPDQPLKQLAAKHAKLTFANDSTGRPYIASGKIDHIKAFLREAARESMRLTKAEDETLTVGILDQAGAVDHPASKRQQKDIEAVLRTAKSLTPR
jgi:hypothetical protein